MTVTAPLTLPQSIADSFTFLVHTNPPANMQGINAPTERKGINTDGSGAEYATRDKMLISAMPEPSVVAKAQADPRISRDMSERSLLTPIFDGRVGCLDLTIEFPTLFFDMIKTPPVHIFVKIYETEGVFITSYKGVSQWNPLL